MKNKLELVRLVFQKILDIISQIGNAHINKHAAFLMLCLKYIKLCLQSIKIHKTIP